MSIFWPKNAGFLQKNADISKIKGALVPKLYFLKLHMNVYLRAKFQVLEQVLDGGGRGRGNFTPPPHLKTNP